MNVFYLFYAPKAPPRCRAAPKAPPRCHPAPKAPHYTKKGSGGPTHPPFHPPGSLHRRSVTGQTPDKDSISIPIDAVRRIRSEYDPGSVPHLVSVGFLVVFGGVLVVSGGVFGRNFNGPRTGVFADPQVRPRGAPTWQSPRDGKK